MKNQFKLILCFFILLFVTSCNDDENVYINQANKLEINLRNLPQLPQGSIYEGWLVLPSGKVSTGRFTVDSDGVPSITSFESEQVAVATSYLVSIEPANETGQALETPSNVILLAGDFSGNSTLISMADSRALGTDFSGAKGIYEINTPTTLTNEDRFSGVWFTNLTLPTLEDGWIYEGWAEINGTLFSTGRFLNPTKADDSAQYSGTEPAPDKPGEDFVQGNTSFPINLQGATLFISVEPNENDAPNVFGVKPLMTIVPTDAIPVTNYDFEQTLKDEPIGVIKKVNG